MTLFPKRVNSGRLHKLQTLRFSIETCVSWYRTPNSRGFPKRAMLYQSIAVATTASGAKNARIALTDGLRVRVAAMMGKHDTLLPDLAAVRHGFAQRKVREPRPRARDF